MRISIFAASIALALAATPAAGVVKVYDSTAPNGTTGDEVLFTLTLCPPVVTSPGRIQGSHRLDDAGAGTVTIVEMNVRRIVFTDFGDGELVPTFGPGAFVFATSDSTASPIPGTTHPGSTAPGGTVDWGILGGWLRSGVGYCIASPQTVCTGGAGIPHGVTTPIANFSSPTFDIGTWVFDAVGDFEAALPYIHSTNNGGTANQQFFLRGAFVGGSVPALPLVGLGALALGLAVAGARAALRRR